AMIGAHLDRGDAAAAAALAAEHPDLPPPLGARLEEARAEREREQAMLEAVRREQREMDPRIGRGRRLAFALTLGTLFAIAPVAGGLRTQVFGVPQEPRELLFWPSFGLVVALVAGARWRRTLVATRLNRRLMGTLIFAMALLLAFHLGAIARGLDVETIQVLDIAIFFTLTSVLVGFVSRRLWPSALAFALAFAVAVVDPAWRWAALSVSNWTLFANFLRIWPPFGGGAEQQCSESAQTLEEGDAGPYL
ncbi:MAG TPA: hypothetical protein RMH26_29430, partial [Polyangiaceae bacterium LLY-WYZ-15_(1-7)]|nr:hypothetical protein [Polyangiaceae bacterium LLY-WYZ-15_(1-7)]